MGAFGDKDLPDLLEVEVGFHDPRILAPDNELVIALPKETCGSAVRRTTDPRVALVMPESRRLTPKEAAPLWRDRRQPSRTA